MSATEQLDESTVLEAVHFVGMGGAGMSAVARLMLAQGLRVSGSDAQDSAGLQKLAELGAETFVGQGAGNVGAVDAVVVSTAIRDTNPEYAAALERGIPVVHRSEALAYTMRAHQVVAVAGTHGKTTTSSMTAVMLHRAGMDPAYAIGAQVGDLGSNAALGSGPWYVAEADESDGSFLRYRPRVAVVTNIEPDHLDFYGSAEAFYESFDRFAATIPVDGTLVVCQDDEGSRALGDRHEAAGGQVLRYGRAPGSDLQLGASRVDGLGTVTEVRWAPEPGVSDRAELVLAVPGEHNVSNAGAALCVGLVAGLELGQAATALAGFHGSARRFDFRGEDRGVRVFDDYAHHPTEVRAALTAARAVAGEHRVLVLFQPHLFSRTREFAAEFAAALELADAVRVLDVYPAREQPIPGVTSELITGAADDRVGYAPDAAAAVQELADSARQGDVVLTVGAGSVTELAGELVRRLGETRGTV